MTDDRLPAFRIRDWPEPVTAEETGGLFGMSDSTVTTRIVMEVTVAHRRRDDAWIHVVTHRPDDSYQDLKDWMPTNMLLRAAHRLGTPPPDADALRRRSTTIAVDGVDVEFDVSEYDRSWVATAQVSDVFVTLDGEGVALDDVALVSWSPL